MQRLALFDLDGTLTRGDTYRGFVAQLLLRHPERWPRALLLPLPFAAYALRFIDRGTLKGAILHLLFEGMPREVINTFAQRYAASAPTQMFAEAVATLKSHLNAGDHVVLLSASPDLYVPAIGRLLGAHETFCTPIRWNGQRLDGRLDGPNHRGPYKTRVLEQLRVAHPGLSVIAYGNSAPDLDHMRCCEEAVFVNARGDLARRLEKEFPAMHRVQWN